MVAETTSASIEQRKWTYSELAALHDEQRTELYDGELVEMTAPKLMHQVVLGHLYLSVGLFVRERDLGQLYMAPHDLYISETRFFEPDLSFVRKERFTTEQMIGGNGACLIAPPDLVVEIISTSTGRNDRVLKFNAYAAFGVTYYWIIDPEEQTLHAFSLNQGRYVAEAALTAEDTFAPTLFPGLQIPLAQLFA